jgi:hypothetical protein
MKSLGLVMLLSAMTASAEADLHLAQRWTTVGAKTLAPGENLLQGSVGSPFISVEYARGVASGLNLGGRLGFASQVEGLLRDAAPGFRAQVCGKGRLLDSGRLSLGLTFDPGFIIYSSYVQGTRAGLVLPVGFRVGLAASSAIAVAVQFEVPMWVEFGPFGGFNVPLLTGVGAEYFVTSHLALFVKARLGPTLRTFRATEVTLDAALGVGWLL